MTPVHIEQAYYRLSFASEGEGPFLKDRQGSLLKIHFSNGTYGYADCHPWHEMGDLPLKEQIALLKDGLFSTPLLQRALAMAQIDAAARCRGVSLFAGLKIPDSHFLVTDIQSLTPDKIEKIVEQGFGAIKIKVGLNLIREYAKLESLARLNNLVNLKFRLDFNERGDKISFIEFIRRLYNLNIQIDFCEDPFPFSIDGWKEAEQTTGIAIAVDRPNPLHTHTFVQILKPAIQNVEILVTHKPSNRLVVTSYLGHPVEQAAAAYVAGRLTDRFPERVDLCGLLSHHVYQLNSFSELLESSGPQFKTPTGTGLGFDDLLSQQQWAAVS